GLVEWPPSPWRIVRALLACGYSTQGWAEVPPVGRRLVEALASTLPRYWLPAAALAHTRHFMPVGVLEKGREKTTLVFDSWAEVAKEPVTVRWDGGLDPDCATLLRVLADHLGYLGRSESWIEAALIPDASLPRGTLAYPYVEGERVQRGWEQVSLLAPETASVYEEWRARSVAQALAVLPTPAGKKKPSKTLEKKRADAIAPYPVDLLDALQ